MREASRLLSCATSDGYWLDLLAERRSLGRLPGLPLRIRRPAALLAPVRRAARAPSCSGDERVEANGLLTMTYQGAALVLGKLDAASFLEPGRGEPTPAYLSIYGTLFLTGAMAAARAEDRATAQEFLQRPGPGDEA